MSFTCCTLIFSLNCCHNNLPLFPSNTHTHTKQTAHTHTTFFADNTSMRLLLLVGKNHHQRAISWSEPAAEHHHHHPPPPPGGCGGEREALSGHFYGDWAAASSTREPWRREAFRFVSSQVVLHRQRWWWWWWRAVVIWCLERASELLER